MFLGTCKFDTWRWPQRCRIGTYASNVSDFEMLRLSTASKPVDNATLQEKKKQLKYLNQRRDTERPDI